MGLYRHSYIHLPVNAVCRNECRLSVLYTLPLLLWLFVLVVYSAASMGREREKATCSIVSHDDSAVDDDVSSCCHYGMDMQKQRSQEKCIVFVVQ